MEPTQAADVQATQRLDPELPVGPEVDRNRCEGKSDCVRVCPEDVFEVRRMEDADFAQLSFLGKLKSRVHGRLTAYTPNAAACQACGLCVTACPERAIRLVPRAGEAAATVSASR